jgi:aminopeptidase N
MLDMNRIILLVVFNLLIVSAFAQSGDDYRTTKNPLYWKNRMPDKAYWQQDVDYTINARIDETTHVIQASETLEYWNNSPDTLTYVYFHLFQNAFIKGSHLHELEKAGKVKERLGKYEAQGLGTVIEGITVNGKETEPELDNTVMKVLLDKPLYPGKSVTFKMNFKTYYDNGATRRRMKMYDAWGFKHYNGVQWFPKICVYDRKFGWETYQHLNKEFYADFGSYDVSLDFPSNYIVEATGVLQNRKEVLPDELREKLDIKNFAKKRWNEVPSTIIPYVKGERKVWKYKATNVHDFAFTADPSYRISTTMWNGIECVGLAQEPHASGWQNSSEYVAKIIKTFSEDVGMYQYPKMVAADAADGMEYPMLTLDGGSDPGYRGLLVHEIAHNWFYGMVGSNETYRAALDEGFTQFLTAWGLRKIDGDTLVQTLPKSKYRRHFAEPVDVLDLRVLNAYTTDAINKDELPLNTHSNDFQNALGHEGGYRGVYYKTASMLYNLQYTLGDSLFQAAFKNYFHQWRFAHPYFEDFRSSIINYTNVDLNWFFDQWLETTKNLDYGIGRIKREEGNDRFSILFKRKGQMQMPLDFTVTAKDGSKYNYHIPNTWFEKNTSAVTLPKWYGWGAMYDEYKAEVQVPGGIRDVQIDTTNRFADIDYENNYRRRGILPSKAIKLKWDGGLANPIDRKHYRLYVRPDLWYNAVDGIKAGIHFEGDYLRTLHKLDATVWFNTHLLQHYDYVHFTSEGVYDRYVPVNYSFNYASPLAKQMPKLQLQLNSRLLDGLWYHRGGFNWLQNDANTISLYAQTMWRNSAYDLDYLNYPNEWSGMKARPNSSLNAAWTHNYRYMNGNGSYTLSARAPMFTGNSADDFDYAYAQLEAINHNQLAKLEIHTRLFARYGTGTNLPYESILYAAGANNEEMMEDKYTRSKFSVQPNWFEYSQTTMGNVQQGGGLNLRGYAGYLIGDTMNGAMMIGYKGRSGVSANVEVDVDNYIKLRPKFTRNWLHADVYAFADAGIIELSTTNLLQYWDITPTTTWSNLRMDAGVGFAFTIKKWGVFEKAKPLTLRVDLPFFVNRPPYAEPDYFNFRWVVGVNRSF